jgi:hypothetical protein
VTAFADRQMSQFGCTTSFAGLIPDSLHGGSSEPVDFTIAKAPLLGLGRVLSAWLPGRL